MPCPTCNATLNHVADFVYLCPRCGTARVTLAGNSRPDIYVPKLVERCRGISKELPHCTGEQLRLLWHRYGIAESINTPEGRP